MRPRAAVGQADPSFEAVPRTHLWPVARLMPWAQAALATVHLSPTLAHNQELAAKTNESRRTMRHASLPAVRSFNTPYRAQRLSLVNNAP